MTAEIWSTTPPSEDGWYWVKRGGCVRPGSRHRFGWVVGGEMIYNQEVESRGFQFGPRIPPAEELAAMQAEINRLRDLCLTEIVRESERLGLYDGEAKGGDA